MPYIKKDRRPVFSDKAFELGRLAESPGELNFSLSELLGAYVASKGESYDSYNEVLGVIEAVKLELYREQVGPYERSKKLTNGALSQQTDLAWAAGFFDGEGNTNYTHQRDRKGNLRPKGRMQLSVAQKEPLLLIRFREAVDGIGYLREGKITKTRPRPIWWWTCTKFEDCYQVVALLWDELGIPKREQALLALEQWADERDETLTLPEDVLDDWPR